MRKTGYYIISSVILVLFIVVFSVFAEESNDNKARRFLLEYGWETGDECIDKSVIIVPEPFDLVYENYNALQEEAGLNLKPYQGKRGVRYTYEVINYPYDVGEAVRANVIIIDGECVGGDICTVSLEGFIHSLVYPELTNSTK